jgi:uncharacterized membrane protein YhaH (DUF805 family)
VTARRLHDLAVSPRFWLVFHLFGVGRWLVLFIPGMLLWRDSVPFLMYVSLVTALTGSLAGFGAALAARKADPDDPM